MPKVTIVSNEINSLVNETLGIKATRKEKSLMTEMVFSLLTEKDCQLDDIVKHMIACEVSNSNQLILELFKLNGDWK